MLKLMLLITSVFWGCILITHTVSADDASNKTIDNDTVKTIVGINKDSWLKSVTPILPSLICKGFANDPELKIRFDEIQMTYEQCITVIPDSVSKCQRELYSEIPDKINNDNAAVWGKSLGECIGKDFAIKYLIPKNN